MKGEATLEPSRGVDPARESAKRWSVTPTRVASEEGWRQMSDLRELRDDSDDNWRQNTDPRAPR